MISSSFQIRSATWLADRKLLLSVRTEVFVKEQKVPEEIEVDEFDATSFHVLAISTGNQQPIGTARLLPDARIGRVAVLKEWRKRNVGVSLMIALMERARIEQHQEVFLNAQTQTIGFYEKLGFSCVGPEFQEAGIPHFRMRRALS